MRTRILSFLLLTLILPFTASFAQDRPTITPENAASVQPVMYTGRGVPTAVAFSPDGSRVAVATYIGLYMHQGSTEADILPLEYTGSGVHFNDVAFTLDGATLIGTTDDGNAILYDGATGETLGALQPLEGTSLESIAISPDGSTAAFSGDDGQIAFVDLSDGSTIETWKGNDIGIYSMDYSPDGNTLVTLSFGFQPQLVAWDVTSGEQRYAAQLEGGTFPTAAFNPDGSWLAVPSSNTSVAMLDPLSGEFLLGFSITGYGIQDLEFAPNGDLVSAVGEPMIKVSRITFPAEEGIDPVETQELRAHRERVIDTAVSNDGTRMVSVGSDGQYIVWDLTTNQLETSLQAYTGYGTTLAPMQDSTRVALGGTDGQLVIWDSEADTRQTFNPALNTSMTGGQGIESIDFNADETQVLLALNNSFVRTFTFPDFEDIWFDVPGSGTPIDAEFSPDGSSVAYVGGGNTPLHFSTMIEDTDPIDTPESYESFSAVHWTPDGTYATVALGFGDPRLIWWSSEGTEPFYTVNGPDYQFYNFAFNPTVADGHVLAFSGGQYGDPFVAIVDLSDNSQINLDGHTAPVYALAYSPDASVLATASADNTIRLWDTSTGEELAVLEAHTASVKDVAFSPDGTRLFSIGSDGIALRWEVVE